MSYLDRKDLLSADLMTRSISKEGSIKYYNSDKNVANIYMKLMAESQDGAQKEVLVDEASNYTVTITVKKPGNSTKEVAGVLSDDLVDETCAIYKFALPSEFTDQVGDSTCETVVKNDTKELVMNTFVYSVKADMLTGLNGEIVTDPDLPILKELIQEVKETAQTVNNIDNVNVSDTKTYSNKKIEEKFSGVDAQFNTIANEMKAPKDYYILKSPNGIQYKVVVDNNGVLKVIGINDENLEGLLEGRLLVWHDEFDGTIIDRTKWRSSTNNSSYAELQAYTYERDENAYIENGQLILKAIREAYIDGYDWTSARLDTMGLFGVKYGRIEAKLKYESKNGAFPAFWTLGCNTYYPSSTSGPYGVTKSYGAPWPYCGELDIFEGVSGNNGVNPIIHYSLDPSTSAESNMTIASNSTVNTSEYHIYGVEWTETSMTAYLDGEAIGTIDTNGLTPYNKPHYLILNLALGSIAGAINDNVNDIKMYVDWVRVYSPESVTQKLDISNITLSKSSMALNIGDPSQYIDYESTPSNTVNSLVTLTSSDSNIFTVYGTKLSPIATGNANLIATSYNGITTSIPIQVGTNLPVYAESITLSASEANVSETKTYILTTTMKPNNCNETLSWSSSDDTVATVSNGIITGVKAGYCTITAYSPHDNSVKDTCAITVDPLVRLTIPSNGLVLQLDKNGMNQYSWTNSVDSIELPWLNAYNSVNGVNSAVKTDGKSFWWEGTNYTDYSMMDLSSYYDADSQQSIILNVDYSANTSSQDFICSSGTNGGANTVRLSLNGVPQYFDSTATSITKTGNLNGSASKKYTICIRYDNKNIKLSCLDYGGTIVNSNAILNSEFNTNEKFYLGVKGGKGKNCKYKVCAVYNRVITDEEVSEALTSINEFANN